MIYIKMFFRLYIPTARSLKDRRNVLRKVRDRLRNLSLSVAMREDFDSLRRADLAVTWVVSHNSLCESMMDEVQKTLDGIYEVELLSISQDISVWKGEEKWGE